MKRRRLVKPDDATFATAAHGLSLGDATQLYASIGQGDVSVTLAIKHLFPNWQEAEAPKPTFVERLVVDDRLTGVREKTGLTGPALATGHRLAFMLWLRLIADTYRVVRPHGW